MRKIAISSRTAPEVRPVGRPDGLYGGLLVVSERGEPHLLARRVKTGRATRAIARKLVPVTESVQRGGEPVARIPAITLGGVLLPPRFVPVAELVYDAWREPGILRFDGRSLHIGFRDGDRSNVAPENLVRETPEDYDGPRWRPLPFVEFPRYRAAATSVIVSLPRRRHSSAECALESRPHVMCPVYIKDSPHPHIRLSQQVDRRQVSGPVRLGSLIAGAWCTLPPGCTLADVGIVHRDGDASNCAAQNLEIVDEAQLVADEALPVLGGGRRFMRLRTGEPFVDTWFRITDRGALWKRRCLSLATAPGQRVARDVLPAHWVAPYEGKDGYLVYSIGVPGRATNYFRAVHALVGEAGHGPLAPEMEWDHIDGDKRNNALSNLEGVTSQENNCRRGERRSEPVTMRSPEGIVVSLRPTAARARRLRLDAGNLLKVATGGGLIHRGWTLASTRFDPIPLSDVDMDPDDWRVPVLDTTRIDASLYRVNPHGDVIEHATGELIEQRTTTPVGGKPAYLVVWLRARIGRALSVHVHRLVGDTFLPVLPNTNDAERTVIDHIERDSLDNRATHLRRASYRENADNRGWRRPNRIYADPAGTLWIVLDREHPGFCARRGLDPIAMRGVYLGERRTHRGWTRPDEATLLAYYLADD